MMLIIASTSSSVNSTDITSPHREGKEICVPVDREATATVYGALRISEDIGIIIAHYC